MAASDITIPRPDIRHEESIELGLGTPEDPMSMATSYIGTLDHIGTHVDSFFHVKPDGLKIGQMPLEMFFGTAVCFDLTYIPDLGMIEVEDLQRAVEGPSTDAPDHNFFYNHRFCRDRGITHYEWLVNLEELVGKGEFMFFGVPLALESAAPWADRRPL
jgi:kynurenine formamidase